MSSPINRPVSPAESSSSVSSGVTASVASTSSRSSAHTLFYTRDELLVLATSPLSQAPPHPAIAKFPTIVRKTRRGVLEAYQTLEYSRSTSSSAVASTASGPASALDGIPNSNVGPGHLARSRSPRAQLAQLPPPMWKVDVYVPPPRRVEQEQRIRPGRDTRVSRTWRRPAQTRVQTQTRAQTQW